MAHNAEKGNEKGAAQAAAGTAAPAAGTAGAAAAPAAGTAGPAEKKQRFGWILALYLLGLFLGSLNMGIITPVRPIIQNSLGVDSAAGIWMINIFTLMYAAVIPISGKLADRHGRKIVFLASITLFGIGSLLCGVANSTNSFALLLAGRVVQGLGAGGIMPIATAEFGTSFPPEKRGMALGLVGGVYGIGSVLGATAGSAVISLFGAAQWQWVFYMNIPFCVFIIIFGLMYIPNHKAEQVFKIDKLGTLLMVVIIIALLYGLKNIDFFDFIASISQWQAWAPLVLAVVLVPLFVFVEKRAEDPIFHIEYMKNKQIVLTLLIALLVGMVMMGMVFIPQFCENSLRIASGAGGYFVIILGLFSGVVSPVSGAMIDRFGEKGVMLIGLVISAVGSFYLAFVAVAFPNLFNVVVSLILIGLGMGFTMGTPLNYMMMANTKIEESNAALATLSLVRSIGTAVAPALMVGFIIQAGAGMQARLMDTLPTEVEVSPLPHAVELDQKLDAMRSNPDTADMLGDLDIPRLSDYSIVQVKMDDMNSSDITISDETLQKLQDSDVTTIVDATKAMVTEMFGKVKPDLVDTVRDGVQQGISAMEDAQNGIGTGIDEMRSSKGEMQQGIDEMAQQIAGMESAVAEMTAARDQMMAGRDQMLMARKAIEESTDIPEPVKQQQLAEMDAKLAELDDGIKAVQAKIDELGAGIAAMRDAMAQMSAGAGGIQTGISEMESQRADVAETVSMLRDVYDAIPGLFDEAEGKYIVLIDQNAESIEDVYQKTVNEGYRNMFILVGVFSVIALVLLLFYKPTSMPGGEEGHGHGHGGHGHGGHGHGAGDAPGSAGTAAAMPCEAAITEDKAD